MYVESDGLDVLLSTLYRNERQSFETEPGDGKNER